MLLSKHEPSSGKAGHAAAERRGQVGRGPGLDGVSPGLIWAKSLFFGVEVGEG